MTKHLQSDKIEKSIAGVAELADAPDLGSGVPDVQVQVLSPAFFTEKWWFIRSSESTEGLINHYLQNIG